MSKPVRLQISVVVIISALVYMMLQGAHNFSSYFVTVRAYCANPQKFQHREVRVQGSLLAQSVHYNAGDGVLSFTLISGSQRLRVQYRGAMPDERFHAASAIVKGEMGAHGVFDADKLEIQCPDHYGPAREDIYDRAHGR